MDEPYILSEEEFLKQLTHRIENRIPTSAIRKSDGENVVLAFGVLDSIPRKKYLKKMKHYNIRPWEIGFQQFIKLEMAKAFRNADLLGISHPEMRIRYWADELKILEYFELNKNTFCDLEFHLSFIKKPHESKSLLNSLAEPILTNRKVGVISYLDASEFLHQYNTEIVTRTEIPKRRARFQSMNRETFENVIEHIAKYNSEVDYWLVASGIYAKPFCEFIRKTGGIGIDIGSTIDTWVDDYQTRGHLRKIYQEYTSDK